MRRRVIAAVASIALAGPATAAVQVNDGAILDRRGEDAARKVEIRTISDRLKSDRRGIDCSTWTPGKADQVKTPTEAPKAGAGTATLERADPTVSSSPAFTPPSATGSTNPGQGGQGDWTAAPRAERDQTRQVVGGMETVQASVQPNRQTFEAMGRSVGSDGTLMEVMDRNSAIRTQTGLTFNQALQGVAYLAQAFNLGNLTTAGMTSQATRGLSVPIAGAVTPLQTIGLCPAGTTGEGSAARPCVTDACSATAASGCVTRRVTDAAGNVSYLVEQVQIGALSAQAPLSTDELMAAIGQYESR